MRSYGGGSDCDSLGSAGCIGDREITYCNASVRRSSEHSVNGANITELTVDWRVEHDMARAAIESVEVARDGRLWVLALPRALVPDP